MKDNSANATTPVLVQIQDDLLVVAMSLLDYLSIK